MSLVKVEPKDIRLGMIVFIQGCSCIDPDMGCTVTYLYPRPRDLGFQVEDVCGDEYTIGHLGVVSGDISVFVQGVKELDCVPPQPTGEESRTNINWSDSHYSFKYYITEQDTENGNIKIDPYFVSKQWQLGKKDDTGTIFHILKTIARFGDKNSKEREIKALYAQVVRLAELEGVALN